MKRKIFSVALSAMIVVSAVLPTTSAAYRPCYNCVQETVVQSGSVSQIERQAMELVNRIRKQNGLEPLTISEDLSVKARVKAQDMKTQGYFSHNSPTYGTPFQMMKRLGVSYRSAGENIAMGYRSAEAVVNAWMNSPNHRAAILSTRYTTMGIGYADGYWAQWFIS